MKGLISFTLALLLMAGIVSAQMPTPQPVSGIIDAYGDKSGYGIEIEVLGTNIIPVTLVTDSMGFYMWDFSGKLLPGNELVISVYLGGEKIASKTVSFNGNPIEVPTFDLKEGVDCPDCPVCPTCEVCTDCEVCPECNSCCPQPEPCPDCPGQDWTWILGLLGITGVAGIGVGFYATKNTARGKHGVGLKIYTGNDGIVKTLHKHHGIRGYHDPDTSHQDPDEKHKKGELCPLFEKNEDGKWVYVGD